MTGDPLDNPVLASVTGAHRALARSLGRAWAFEADVAPFAALPDAPTIADWRDLARLLGPGTLAVLAGQGAPPAGWHTEFSVQGRQMVATAVDARTDPEAVVLGADDVPEMLDLTARTRPGPFLPRTIELGAYLGLRVEGRLAAMAGERLHPAGATEISAVCTDPDFRGRGLAARLVRALVAGVEARGETAILHVVDDNASAIRLYENLGFETRRSIHFAGHLPPVVPPLSTG